MVRFETVWPLLRDTALGMILVAMLLSVPLVGGKLLMLAAVCGTITVLLSLSYLTGYLLQNFINDKG